MAAVPPATQSANLNPPKQDAISKATLSTMNGANGGPIWLAIKGHVFDVSSKPDMYGPGGGYSVFAGKDGSKGLGLGSLKPEDAVPDDGALGPAEQKVLDDWLVFFQKVSQAPADLAPVPLPASAPCGWSASATIRSAY